ncbi:MAG TPA: hypothetical protein VIC71_05935 [Gammaproteobacteria bacterium]|jgi:hypothetical protein
MFTLIHVVLSLLGIVSGCIVVGGLVAGARLTGWTVLFLATTALTSATGFGFPFTVVTPAHIIAVVSLVVIAVCLAARHWKQLEGRWRVIYVVASVTVLYLNVFVLVVQLFEKIPALVQLAPWGQGPIFAVTQALMAAFFVWIGRAAIVGFRRAQ